nr:hypothetical protein [Tanacetum cinerariifolium]
MQKKQKVDQSYMLFLVWSAGSTNPQNNAEDAAFDEKEHDFDVKKPVSEVILSLSSSAQSKEQDDKTKKEAKGKSHVEPVIGYRDLNAEFEDCSKNSSNEVNAAGFVVPTVGQNSLNSTNTFSAASSSSGAQTRKQGDKTENKDKGKSLVITITRFRDLNAEFEECTNNISNGVNAASSSISTVGHNFINITNDFSAAGPSNAAASPTAA